MMSISLIISEKIIHIISKNLMILHSINAFKNNKTKIYTLINDMLVH